MGDSKIISTGISVTCTVIIYYFCVCRIIQVSILSSCVWWQICNYASWIYTTTAVSKCHAINLSNVFICQTVCYTLTYVFVMYSITFIYNDLTTIGIKYFNMSTDSKLTAFIGTFFFFLIHYGLIVCFLFHTVFTLLNNHGFNS